MDSGKFDDIIKGKLESFEDDSSPSASEWSRLSHEMPHISAPPISWTSSAILVTNVLLVISTIFFIYRTFILHDELVETRHEVVRLEHEIRKDIYLDSLVFDSLRLATQSMTLAFDQDMDSLKQALSMISLAGIQNSPASPEILKEDQLDEAIQTALNDFVASLESDPELLASLLEKSQEEPIPIVVEKPKPVTFSEKLQDLGARALAEGYLDDILVTVAADSSGNQVINDLITGTDPSIEKEDRLASLSTDVSPEHIQSLPDTRKRQLFEQLMLVNPDLTTSSAQKAIDNEGFVQDLQDLSSPNMMLVQRDRALKDTLIASSNEDIRKKQRQKMNQQWWASFGAGVNRTPMNEAGTPRGNVISGLLERKMNPRWSIVSGLEYAAAQGENYNTEEVDLSIFADVPEAVLGDIKELKVNLVWMDVPIEGRFYLLPGRKINPFLGASFRTRFIVDQSYKIESNSNGDVTPDFQPGNTFSIPVVGFTGGTVFEFGPRVSGGVRLQQTIGGTDLGPFNNKLNSLSGQAMLLFRLDR